MSRMLQISFSVFLLVLVSTNPVCAGRPDTLWTRVYEHGNGISVAAIAEAGESEYLILGTTSVPPIGDSYLYLMKINASGDTLWTRLMAEGATARSMIGTADGGYLILARLRYDIYLLKIDDAGDTLWTRTYGWSYPGWGNYDDDAFSIHDMQDGTYSIVGLTGSEIPWDYRSDVILMRTDSSGDTLWTRRYDWTGMTLSGEKPCFGLPTADGNFMLIGYTELYAASESDVLAAKVDDEGDSLWMRTYDASAREHAYAAVPTDDGGCIILGNSNASGDWLNWVLRINAEGDTLWTRYYAKQVQASSPFASRTADGNHLVVGCADGASGDTDIHLLKATEEGDTLWTALFGLEACQRGNVALETEPGTYIVAGRTGTCGDPSGGPRHAFIMKVVEAAPDTVAPDLELAVFQNPYLTRYLDIYIIGSEALDSASVMLRADDTPIPVRPADETGRVWAGDFKLQPGTGTVSLSATASDSAGNDTTVTRSLSYGFVEADAGGIVRGPRGEVTLALSPHAMRGDAWIIIVPCAGDIEEAGHGALGGNVHLGTVVSEKASHAFYLGPPGILTETGAYLELSYGECPFDLRDPCDLSIVKQDEGALESYVDLTSHTIGARVSDLGTFRLEPGNHGRTFPVDPGYLVIRPSYPNPFSRVSRVTFELRAPQRIRADIFDILGRHIASLLDTYAMPGSHTATWDGSARNTETAPSGIYFLKVSGEERSATAKIILAR